MSAFTCKDCTERVVGCHSNCEKYLNEKAEYDKIKAIEDREKIVRHYTGGWIDKFKSNSAKKASGFNPSYNRLGGR